MALFAKRNQPADAAASQDDVGEAPVTFLVADDDAHDQMLFAMAAEDCEISPEVTFVDDGLMLLEHLRRQASLGRLPDLVVLDLRMPRLSGHDVLTEIAADPELDGIASVVFSTSRRTKDIDDSVALGARSHEVKPSSYDELVAFIDRSVKMCLQDRRGSALMPQATI